MIKLWRCEVCGDPYVGQEPPKECPFCGAHSNFIKEAGKAKVNFNFNLTEKDKKIAEHALEVEVSNTTFYYCAAANTEDEEAALLFKALGKVEEEHVSIWKKVLGLEEIPDGDEGCSSIAKENLEAAHEREEITIEFYTEAAKEADSTKLKRLFAALIAVEKDHLQLHEERMD